MLNNSERNWIDGIVDDTESALRGVARLIEPARVDKATKEGINFSNRFMWVFRDNPQVRDKHTRLSVCHQSLTAVIACLYAKDVVVAAPVPDKKKEEQPPPYDLQLEELFNWRNRRRRAKRFMSLPSVAAGSSTPATSVSADTVVASATSRVPIQSDDFAQDPPSSHPHSAFGILTEPRFPHTSLTKDSIRRPMSVDAVPIGRIPIASRISLVDLQKVEGRRPVSIDSAASEKALAGLTREAKVRQRQFDEQATNSRLPYPMSPSDYMTGSTLDSDGIDSTLDLKTPLFPGIDLPHFKGNSPKLNTMNSACGTSSSNDINTLGPDPPQDQNPTSVANSCPSTSQTISDPYFDVNNGMHLLNKETRVVDEQYQHPPFSFSSFAPLITSDDDSQQILPEYDPHRKSLSPAFEGLQSVAELAASVDGPSNQDQDSQPDSLVDEGSFMQDPIRSPHVSPQRVRRGGRSWLMYHASRSDFGHYTG